MKRQSNKRLWVSGRSARLSSVAGMTLIELILACAILAILSSAAVPLARLTVHRQKEVQLHQALREMRTAIDRYKDDADKNLIRTEVGSENYPPDLQTLVDGVTVSIPANAPIGVSAAAMAAASGGNAQTAAGAFAPASSGSDVPNKVRYLRKIPVDPMTGKDDWGLRAVQDDPDSHSWSGHNVFDVYSQSTATALDGTMYQDW